MAQDTISSWLARKRVTEMAISTVCCVVAFIAGMALLALMFSVITVVVVMVLFEVFHQTSIAWVVSVLITTAIMALLAYDSFTSGRDDMGNIPLWMFRECCSFGPRLVHDSLRHFNRLRNLARLDVPSCSIALTRLARQSKSVTLDELLQLCPGMSRARLRQQLLLIHGVLLIGHDSRVLLSEPLRLILSPLLHDDRKFEPNPEPEPEPTPVHEPEKLSPHEILGISANATLVEIKMAYRNRIKDCHPDRFANMDQTSRERAEKWSKALNAAYATLVAERKR